jgi:MoaA/NifB/PqqE/SkfB family radical SAM enzyme
VLPWISLETSPIGSVRPCCLAEDELRDNSGEKFNLTTAKFDMIQNSHDMRRLRQAFIDGDEPETCKKCWNEERSGRTSKRMHTLDRLKHILPEQDWTLDAKPLMFLDLKLGNICNLKCRICGSWSSSTFAVEEIANNRSPNLKSSYHYQMLKQGRWPRENTVFWEQIADSVDQLRYLEFTGGEPFMIEEHFDLLRRLVDQGVAQNIEIHYNTNGTMYPDHAEEIWRHFKLVEIAFSIDDVGTRFEYQRSGAIWEDVQRNIKLFKEIQKRLSNIQLQVCTTVNVFNVCYLEDVANWIDTQDFDFVYWNMMHEAYYFSISTLPQSAKYQIKEILSKADVSEETRQQFEHIIEFMMSGTSLDGRELRRKIAEVDRRREQNLFDVEANFATLIEYKGPDYEY